MKYLARAVSRRNSAVVPALRTTSPLAELDQRLHLDGFAQDFASPLTAAPPQRAERRDELEKTSAWEEVPPEAPTARKPRLSTPPPPRAPATPTATRTESSPASTAAGVRQTAAPSRVAPAPLASKTEAAAPTAEAPQNRRSLVSTPEADEAASRVSRATARTPGVTASEPEEPTAMINAARADLRATGPAHPAHVTRAFTELAAWLESPPSPRRDPEAQNLIRQVPEPPAPQRPEPALQRPHERFTVRSTPTAPVHRLEIGNIEVEVVLPERRVPAQAQASGTPSTSLWRPPFGWRQR